MKCLVYLIILSLSGCAQLTMTSRNQRSMYEHKMDSWIEKDENQLVQTWGAPHKVYQTPDGGKTITYREERQGWSWRGTSGGGYWCESSFNLDSGGIIRSWTCMGNDCK